MDKLGRRALPHVKMSYQACPQKVTATSPLPAGVPGLACNKSRDFIQVNSLQTQEAGSFWCKPKAKGVLVI